MKVRKIMLLEKQAQKEINKQLKQSLNTIKSFESLQTINNWSFYRNLLTKKEFNLLLCNKLTLAQAKKALKEHIKKYYDKQLQKVLKEIQAIKGLKDERIKIWGQCDIDWVKNRTWGSCPRGRYCNGNYYQDYKSVTGCGYCKLSTLTANMLNDDKTLIKYIMLYIEKHAINADNIREKLGYGIRIYNGLPYFGGAVGIECHIKILKNLGFNVQYIDLKNADSLRYSQK